MEANDGLIRGEEDGEDMGRKLGEKREGENDDVDWEMEENEDEVLELEEEREEMELAQREGEEETADPEALLAREQEEEGKGVGGSGEWKVEIEEGAKEVVEGARQDEAEAGNFESGAGTEEREEAGTSVFLIRRRDSGEDWKKSENVRSLGELREVKNSIKEVKSMVGRERRSKKRVASRTWREGKYCINLSLSIFPFFCFFVDEREGGRRTRF